MVKSRDNEREPRPGSRTLFVAKAAAPKIYDLDRQLAPQIKENILRLQVAVNNVFPPKNGETGHELVGISLDTLWVVSLELVALY